MADIPSRSFQKKHRFSFAITSAVGAGAVLRTIPSGGMTVSAEGMTAVALPTAAAGANDAGDAANRINLSDRALPIQQGVVGAFGGAIVQLSVSGVKSASSTGTIGTVVLHGSVDGTNFVALTAASGSISNITAAAAGTSSVGTGLLFFNNPLPQFLRAGFTIGTEAITEGTINIDVYVNG
jgi:hypothetical protein